MYLSDLRFRVAFCLYCKIWDLGFVEYGEDYCNLTYTLANAPYFLYN